MQAIVLARRPVREFDEAVMVFSYELGKVEALARSNKKITSRQSAHVEPGTIIDCALIPGRERLHLAKTQTVWAPLGARRDWLHIKQLGNGLALVNHLVGERVPDRQIFALVKEWLGFLNVVEIPPVLGIDALAFRLLALLGFTVELNQCLVCARPLADLMRAAIDGGVRQVGFSVPAGGLVCDAHPEVREQGNWFRLEIDLVYRLVWLDQTDWSKLGDWVPEEAEARVLHALVFSFAQYHAELGLRDWS